MGNLKTKVHYPYYLSLISNCQIENCIGDFFCTRHKFCIPIENVCDGTNDCWDNEDEINCSKLKKLLPF